MGELVNQGITWMRGIGMIECKKAGPKFLCSVTELMIDINLDAFRPPPLILSISFKTWIRNTCHKYFVVPSENYSGIPD